jgi:general secretion pathway protein G
MTLRKSLTRQTARRGFTLLEILIVVAIIVVIAGVGAVYIIPQFEKSKEDAAHLKAKEVEKAATTFYMRYDRWPAVEELIAPVQTANGTDSAILDAEGVRDPWGGTFVLDPSGQRNGGGRPDVYTTAPSGKTIGNWNPKRQ